MLMIDNVLLLLLLVVSLHHGAGLGSALPDSSFYDYQDETDYANCVLSPLPTAADAESSSLAYVTAFYSAESPRDYSVTCSNRSRVHVVVLTTVERRSRGDVRRRLPRIRVNLLLPGNGSFSSQGTEGRRSGSDVVVLASPVSVVWNVRLVHDAPLLQPLSLWVLNASRVVQGSRRVSPVHYFSVATVDKDAVVTWTRRHIGPVTSLVERNGTRAITLRVGPAGCNGVPDGLMPLQVEGCVLQADSATVRRREVHVIDVSGPSPDVATLASLEVVVQAESRHRRHVVLLLRLAHRATVYLRTERLRGTLDIIAEYAVNTDAVELRQVRVVAERFSVVGGGPQHLLNWSADKYGHPVSYSHVDSSARFIVLNIDAHPVPVSTTPASVSVGQLRAAPATDPVTLVDPVRSRLRSAITRSRSLDCRTDSIVVSVNKLVVDEFVTDGSQLSLHDRSCHPVDNGTDYIWTVGLRDCGTTMNRHKAVVGYDNSIVVSGVEQLAAEAGRWAANGNSDASVVTVPFHCYRSLPSAQLSDHAQSESVSADDNIKYELSLYGDVDFTQPLNCFLAAVHDKQTLYVKASAVYHTDTADRRVMIDNCTVIAADSLTQAHPLIVAGCAWDKTVRWHDKSTAAGTTTDDGSQRFEFVLRHYWTSVTQMSLRCALTTCSTMSDSTDLQVSHCQTGSREWCLQQLNIQDLKSQLHRHRTDAVLVTTGTLLMDRTEITTLNSDMFRSEALRQCSSPNVHVIGLDISAVVGIAFAAFIIGVLLTAALWLIYNRTAVPGVKKRCMHNTSGESTLSCNTSLTTRRVQQPSVV